MLRHGKGFVFMGLLFLLGCATAYMTAGKLYMQQEEYEKAEAQFRLHLDENPQDPDGWWWLGMTYSYRRDYEEACKCFDEVVKIAPGKQELTEERSFLWSVYYDAGLEWQQEENWDFAKSRFTQAAEFEPDSAVTYINLGWVYSNLGQDDSMVVFYQKAIELDPKRLEMYRNLGIHYMKLDEYDTAQEYFEKGLEIDSTNADLWYRLGVCYFLKEDNENAKAAFEHTIELDPGLQDAYFNLGAVLLREKKYEEAIEVLKNAVELRPDDIEALVHLGASYRLTDNYNEAVEVYTKIIELDPENIEAYEGRGGAYWALGMNKEANADLKKAQELGREE